MSSIVKGFAILFMLMLHCYDAEKYEVALNFNHAFMFAHNGFHICVGIYAFMIGYGYAFARTKDLRYGWQHIKKLMIPYLMIFLVFILPTCYKEFFASGWKEILYTLFGLDVRFFYYNWFIYVFIYSMLVLPLITRYIDKKPLQNTGKIIVAFYLGQVFSQFLVYPYLESHFCFMLYNCMTLSPLIVLGYLFSHQRYYERICLNNLSKPLALVGSLFVICLMIFVDSKLRLRGGFLFEFIYVPLLVGAIAVLFSKFEFTYLRRLMVKLGWASMYMWFLQALIHTPIVRTVYQPIVTIFSDINLVVLWTIVVLFIASWLLKVTIDYILNCFAGKNN